MCSRCRFFALSPTSKLSPLGFGNCEHLPVWHHMSRFARCHFDPPRYQEIAA